jgi:hypothetical protein
MKATKVKPKAAVFEIFQVAEILRNRFDWLVLPPDFIVDLYTAVARTGVQVGKREAFSE